MKKLIIIILLFIGWEGASCQTRFSTALKGTSKQAVVLIDRNNLIIQGYDGNEVRIEIDKPISIPEQALGLNRLQIKGLEDNSRLGLNISQEDTLLVIREVCNCYSGTYRVFLPNKLNLAVYESYAQHGQRWEIDNFTGNIEASTEFGNIYLSNTSGATKVHSRHGSVNASINQTKSISLSALYGKLYLEMPENIKANLKIRNSAWGDIFTDFKLPSLEQNSRTMIASLNGGGSPVELQSEHGNIYLKIKK